MRSKSSALFLHRLVTVALVLALSSGCATRRARTLPPTPIMKATQEIPEDELLDVGVTVFEPGKLSAELVEALGSSEDIREAESHYIPYHLKQVLQESAHWGAVRVVPDQFENIDLLIRGRLFESNGQRLHVRFTVVDATGKLWMEKEYDVEVSGLDYGRSEKTGEDPFQPVYNRFANDLAAFRQRLTPDILHTIRTTSQLRFAAEIAPQPYAEYLERRDGRILLTRLPADGDPMMKRLLTVRDSENLYIDTLDKYYEVFYSKMEKDYAGWRKFNETEQEALRELKRSSFFRIAGGVALIAAAIALELGDVENVGTIRDVMVLAGGAVIIDGVNISKQSELHKAGLKELSESFSADLETVVVEFQEQRYELTGTIDEQYQQWRQLLREIYQDETGFPLAEEPNNPGPATE